MPTFRYPEEIDLGEILKDGKLRYGPRLNPVKDRSGVHQPLPNGQLFDRKDMMRVILPTNFKMVETIDVSRSSGKVTVERKLVSV